MKRLLILILVAASLGCQAKPKAKTLDLLTDVHKHLVDARTNIDVAAKSVEASIAAVDETTIAAKADSKEHQQTKQELQTLKDSWWVRTALAIRKWFYAIIIGGTILTIVTAILWLRGGPLAASILSIIFKVFGLIGKLFKRKKPTE